MYNIDSSNSLFNSLLWKAGASEQELIHTLALSSEIVVQLKQKYKHTSAWMDWLHSRNALQLLLQQNPLTLEKDVNGKMLHPIPNRYLSLSHCTGWAIAVESEQAIGVDIQTYSSKLARIATKYIPMEQLEILEVQPNYQDYLHLHWGIKEALFKLYGKGQLDYKKHLLIEPFEIQTKGQLNAKIRKTDVSISCHIDYVKAEDYYLCIATQKKSI